ncbi:MAG TPA: hypothetical protein DCX54_06750 [Flavobacteriales bacterium]|nr:hypothetical protein [Flavobacteriales bacterium]
MTEGFENSRDHGDIHQSVKRFERMLKNNEFYFFDVDEFEDLIDHYMEAGNSKQALKVVNFGCQQHPSSFTLLLYKAQLLASSHKPREALEVLAKVETGEPNNIDIYLIKATVFSQLREYRKAIDNYKLSLPLASKEELEDIYISLAFEYENLDEYPVAIKYLKKTLALNCENETALYEIGFCFDINEICQQGIEFFQEFLDSNPYSHAAWYNLGLLYNKLDMYEKSVSCFDFTIAIKEDFASAWFNKANAFGKMGDYEKAIESYKKTIEIDEEDGTTFFHIANCYEALDRKEDALNYYHKSISADPYFGDAYLHLGFLYEEMGRLNESIHFVKKAIDLDPKQVEYLLAYGSIQIRIGFFQEGINAFEEVISLQNDNPLAPSLLAHALFLSGDVESSYEVILKAIKDQPDNASNYYLHAANLFRENKKEEGLAELEKGLILCRDDQDRFVSFYPESLDDLDILELLAKYNKDL